LVHSGENKPEQRPDRHVERRHERLDQELVMESHGAGFRDQSSDELQTVYLENVA
jgi:hypothetical protein